MQKPDVIRVTNDQNPAVAEAMANVKIGEKVKLEVQATLKGKDNEGYDFTVEAVIPDGYEVSEESEDTNIPMAATSTEPVMTPTAMMVRKKQQK